MRLTIVPVVDQALGPSGCRKITDREADMQIGGRSLGRSSQIFGRAWKPYEGGVRVQFAKISRGGAAASGVQSLAGGQWLTAASTVCPLDGT